LVDIGADTTDVINVDDIDIKNHWPILILILTVIF